MGQQVRVGRELIFEPGAIITGFPGQGQGKTYYVNNITGSATSDGLSWNSAASEVERAIGLSETYRQMGGGAPGVTTNDYIRNTIIVQGTGTAYALITNIPNYTNLIGLGADPRGNGSGIAQVDGAGTTAMTVSSAGCRGLHMVNMQFDQSSAASVYGLDAAKLFRSIIEDCAFTNQGTSGIRIVLGGGVTMRNVVCSNDTYAQITGLTLGSSAQNNGHKIVDCEFFGDTNGVSFSSVAGKQTVFKNSYAYGGTYGFLDTSSSDVGHQPMYIDCYGNGQAGSSINSSGFKVSNNYTRHLINCIENASGTVFNIPDISNTNA